MDAVSLLHNGLNLCFEKGFVGYVLFQLSLNTLNYNFCHIQPTAMFWV